MVESLAAMQETLPARAGKKRYHVGIVEGGPVWSSVFAGFSFPVYTSKVNRLGHEIPSPGAYVWLSEADYKAVLLSISKKVVRWVKRKSGEVIRADVYEKDTMGFVAEPDDEPLAKWIYMDEAPEITTTTVATSVQKILDDERKAAEKSEEKVAQDPKDQKTRELHGKLKARGANVPSEDL